MMKTGLLHVAEDRGADARLDAAVQLAKASGLSLTCAQSAPYPAYTFADLPGAAYSYAMLLTEYEKQQDERQNEVEARLRREGVTFDWVRRSGSPTVALLDQSRLTDIILMSHLESDDGGWDQDLDLIGDVAVHARAPVLSVPYDNGALNLAGSALVAWNGSFEAAQALRFSMPMLSRAKQVRIVTIGEAPDNFPASHAVTYLARHGIDSQLLSVDREDCTIGMQLLNIIIDDRFDLAVLGAYGHSRIRERLLGGVTREILLRCPKPLLLAH